jgi:hypothetical protein
LKENKIYEIDNEFHENKSKWENEIQQSFEKLKNVIRNNLINLANSKLFLISIFRLKMIYILKRNYSMRVRKD